MSFYADKFFYEALKSDDDIISMTDGRIFNPARTTVDEKEDKIPYIIISFNGLTNDTTTKDDVEGDTDTISIAIEVTAESRESLAELTQRIRQRIVAYYKTVRYESTPSENDEYPIDWSFTAGPVQYDYIKPCMFQVLNYSCEFDNNTIDYELQEEHSDDNDTGGQAQGT